MVVEEEFKIHGIDNVVCLSGKDITKELIERCFKLDAVFYRNEFLWDNTGIMDTILAFSEMCFILLDSKRNNIVGYSYWFPIKPEILDQFACEGKNLLDIKPEYCSGYKVTPVNLFSAGEAYVPGYDIFRLHNAVEDIFQYHILCLAKKNIKVDKICIDAACGFDEEFLIPKLGLNNKVQKSNCVYCWGKYDPRITYNKSRFCEELKKYYN